MMTFSNDSLRFPPELLHKVLIHVVGNSIHAICTFPGDIEWDLSIFKTLRGVSSLFRALATEVFCKGFMVPQDEFNLSHVITKRLNDLKALSKRLRDPSKHGGDPFPSPSIYVGVPLMHGYAVYMAAMEMRYNPIHASPETYELSSLTILKALDTALGLYKRIEPEGIADAIYFSLKNERELEHNGLEIVQAFSKLKDHLKSFRDPASGNLRMQSTFIHKELQVVENAHQRIIQVRPTHQFTPGGSQRQVSKLPGVIPVLRDLCALQLGADKYDIHGRLINLVGEWAASCPFINPSQTQPHE